MGVEVLKDKCALIDGKKYLIRSSYKLKTQNGYASQSRIDNSDEGEIEFAFDNSEALLYHIDGVYVEEFVDEIRMVCYHFETDLYDPEYEVLKCKGVAEFRLSKKGFKRIRDSMNHTLSTASLKDTSNKIMEVSGSYQ